MSATRERYAPIDIHTPAAEGWPAVVPPLTFHEAERAVRRLWRWARGKECPFEIVETTGNRYTWRAWRADPRSPGGREQVFAVNAEAGWKRFAHDFSHYHHGQENPQDRPHSKHHARFEARLIKEIIRRGYLDGKLAPRAKPAPVALPPAEAKLDAKRKRAARVEALLAAWERKRKRAETAIKKLNKEGKRLQKALA